MADNVLTIESFGGHDLNDATYEATFADPAQNVFDNPQYTAVLSGRPETFPIHNYGQPQGRRIALTVNVKTLSKANIEQLKRWFDPVSGEQYLIATDGDSVQRRLLCLPLTLHWSGPNIAIVALSAASGLWENVTATTGTEAITTSGETFVVNNPGSAIAAPVFTIKPQSNKSNTVAPIRRRYATVVNRSPELLSDPVGDGYPIDIVNDGFDTDAENTAGQIQADLDDLRVWLNGEEINRWPDPVTDDATTKVWCNLKLRSRLTFTLGAAFASASVPGVGDTFDVAQGEALHGWPYETAVAIENELVRVERLTDTTFEVVERGARGTTAAAHSAGVAGYWVEHLHLLLTYDHTTAVNPAPPDSRKPLISLSASDNGVHEWPGPFFNDEDLRSRAWQRSQTALSSSMQQYVRLYDDAGTMVFEDALPQPGKPTYNNAFIKSPVPVDAAAAAVELDMTVENNMLLQMYLVDLEGNESRLFSRTPSTATNVQFQPAAEAIEVRLHGRIGSVIGYVTADNDDTDAVASSASPFGAWLALNTSTRITEVVFKLRRTDGGANTVDLDLVIGLASGIDFLLLTGFIDDAALGDSHAIFRLTLPDPITIPGGTLLIWNQRNGGQFAHGGSDYRAHPTVRGLIITTEDRSVSPYLLVLTDETPSQADAAHETGDQAVADNIKLTYASEFEPLCLLGVEENCYLYDFTLQNDTTGEYLRIRYPGLFSAGVGTLTIDCENRIVIDDETGEAIPFAVVEASDPQRWLTALPGNNTFSYTEVGVVDTDVDWSFRGRWL